VAPGYQPTRHRALHREEFLVHDKASVLALPLEDTVPPAVLEAVVRAVTAALLPRQLGAGAARSGGGVMAPKAADISVRGSVPWGGGDRNGLPVGRPYVWRRRERQLAAPRLAPASRCDGCGYLETAPGHKIACGQGGGR
jgi:hypothetical protein